MKYKISVAPTAIADLRKVPANIARTILRRIDTMGNGLPRSAERLRDFGYGYRLRVGDYRILFDLAGAQITIQRVRHRSHAYASQPGRKKRKGQH